jgi:hypothetical protein
MVASMARKMFFSADIDPLLNAIDAELASKVEALMIGGGAMSLRGQKTATKDIDLVFVDNGQRKRFIDAITKIGFRSLISPGEEYRKMGARIYVDREERWLDIFNERICNMFLVHEGVLGRASEYLALKRLRVLLMSPEDIFLSKSVTERDGDLEDMYTLFTRGLDEKRIIDEVAFQASRSNKIWESFLALRLGELEEKYNITVTFKARFEEAAVLRMEKLNGKNG